MTKLYTIDRNGYYSFQRKMTSSDILDLAAEIMDEQMSRGDLLTSPDQTKRYLSLQIGGCNQEIFCCLFLDNRHRVISFERLFAGSIDGASVHPREVVKAALKHNAAAVIFAHNHPSGVPEPSGADRAITTRLLEALSLVDVRVLDHVVVAGTETVSMAERGQL